MDEWIDNNSIQGIMCNLPPLPYLLRCVDWDWSYLLHPLSPSFHAHPIRYYLYQRDTTDIEVVKVLQTGYNIQKTTLLYVIRSFITY